MLFLAMLDTAPLPVIEAPMIMADASSVSVPTTSTRKMTYGVCEFIPTNKRDQENVQDFSVWTLHPHTYMIHSLSPKLQAMLSVPPAGNAGMDWDWYIQWKESFKITVLLAPKHGKFVNVQQDTNYQYLPERGYVGRDRVDMLVEAKDDLGRPVSMTIRYFINVISPNEFDAAIANDKSFIKATLEYCGKNAGDWRISNDGSASDSANQFVELGGFYFQATADVQFADLSGASLAQTTNHGWYLDYTPYLNEAFLPTSNPNE